MREVIDLLEAHLLVLGDETEFSSTEEKANHIGTSNTFEVAIKLLKLCEKYNIAPGSIFQRLPDTEDQHFRYVIAHENESSNPSDWEEVKFDGDSFLLDAGDLVIKV